MLSSTLKRTAATLGVLTGLLAAVAPASAQILDGPVMLDTPRANSTRGLTGWPDAPLNDAHALGTQVGSEGVKDKRHGFIDIPAELNTFGGNDTLRAAGTAIGVINDLLDA